MGTRRTRDETGPPAGSDGNRARQPARAASPGGRKAGALDPLEVRRFLLDNPEVLADVILDNPQIRTDVPGLAVHRPDGAIDLPNYLIGRLRGQVEHLKSQQLEIVETARINSTIQGRVHRAALTLLECGTLEQLVAAVSCDLTMLVDVDVAQVVVEIDDRSAVQRCPQGIRLVQPGTIERLLCKQAIRLQPVGEESRQLYGPGGGLAESEALVRLDIGPPTPPALLALGSRRPDMFQPGMRTDLLAFLARVLEHCLRQSLARGY